jgi:outer membrane protein OmpA-like peptidoglycan-associated protein
MRFGGSCRRVVGLCAGALLIFASAAAFAQAPLPTDKLIERLAGLETAVELDLAALRLQAAERIKSRTDHVAVKRPPIAAQLLKLPQLVLDIKFDTDSPIVRPESYQLVGQLADALSHPTLRSYRFLIVGHTEAVGRRDHNLTLSQRRADAIREVLVNTFKISPKRLQAVGLGEEQFLDAARPTAPVNRQLHVMTVGKL